MRGKLRDKLPSICQIDVVSAASERGADDAIILSLKRPRAMNDDIRTQRAKRRFEFWRAQIYRCMACARCATSRCDDFNPRLLTEPAADASPEVARSSKNDASHS